MEPIQNDEPSQLQEQRTLASIMFTDVVGFSKLSSINEERTYLALQRDFNILYREVGKHGGTVLNTMGDGMMVMFTSAVEAIRCAVSIQKELHQIAMDTPVHGILQHRIGLHVGDIILNGKNTMGDGVNVAARIQSMARPDSIAMSKEFFSMVDGKAEFNAKSLGPRRARNIPESINLYEIAPILDELRLKAAEAMFVQPEQPVTTGATGRKAALLLVIFMIFVVGAGASILMLIKVKDTRGIQVKQGGMTRAEKQKLAAKLGSPKAETPDTNTPAGTDSNVPTQVNAPFEIPADIKVAIDALKQTYNFSAIVATLQVLPGATQPEGQSAIARYQELSSFHDWLDREVKTATDSNPLFTYIRGTEVKIYAGVEGVTFETASGEMSTKGLWERDPDTLAAVGQALLNKSVSGSPIPGEASHWLQVFSTEYNL